jgi:hypothetical protein
MNDEITASNHERTWRSHLTAGRNHLSDDSNRNRHALDPERRGNDFAIAAKKEERTSKDTVLQPLGSNRSSREPEATDLDCKTTWGDSSRTDLAPNPSCRKTESAATEDSSACDDFSRCSSNSFTSSRDSERHCCNSNRSSNGASAEC